MRPIKSHQAGREDWYVTDWMVSHGRAFGKLMAGRDVIRHSFSVKVNSGEFAVDIGTGSGVKVKFKVPKKRAA